MYFNPYLRGVKLSGQLPNFQSGSNLLIYIGNTLCAYATNLSWQRSMAQAGVSGIGSYSYDAIEAVGYSASGSFTITRYSKATTDAVKGKAGFNLPVKTNDGFNNSGTDGNSMLHPSQFNPQSLLYAKTFDIKVMERTSTTSNEGQIAFILQNCRMESYSIGFTPGSLVSENISFRCLKILDAADGSI